jgi:8-amino-7-oxononanoate synthase
MCAARDAWLLVDDAHGLGVLGADGGGTLQQLGLDSRAVPLLMGTLGKAFGCFGAFVAGDHDVIEWLLQRARTYIYTTALPPSIAAAARAALRLCQSESWRRDRLQHNIRRFRQHAAQLAVPLLPSGTAIQPLIVGGAQRACELGAQLEADGFWVSVIRPPTVPEGTARLRITLCSEHRDEDLDRLIESVATHLRQPDRTPDAAVNG